jgi:hypothetical protein
MVMLSPLVPLFALQAVFGDPPAFRSSPLSEPTAGAIDGFLGFAPGTTIYGADTVGGQLWGLTGSMTAPSLAAVQSLQQNLLSYAGWVRNWGRPNHEQAPGNYQFVRNCMFLPSEVVFSKPGPLPASGAWSCTYKLVMRQIGAVGG